MLLGAICRSNLGELEGWVDADGFRLGLRRRGYRNSFAPYIRGEMRDAPGGTTIRCHFTMHPIVVALCCIWCVVSIIGASVAGAMVSGLKFQLLFVLLVFTGVVVSASERDYLLDQLKYTIGANPSEP
jgi:hypothetical protein